jgi:hypothetical protein
MIRISRLAMIAAVAAIIATPAFAQSFDPDVGSGNVLPFSSAPRVAQTGKIADRKDTQGKMTARRSGLHAFAMVPGAASGFDSNSPAVTGGGSLGYNQLLLQN